MSSSKTDSPYRQAPRNELVIRGAPSTTVYLWGIWLTAAALVAIALMVDDVRRTHALFFASVMAAGVVCALLHIAARRVLWILTLEDARLRIERRSLGASESVAIGVGNGLRIGLGMTERFGRMDPCIVLASDSTRVIMAAGARPSAVIDGVTDFLREQGVAVSELPDGPLAIGGNGGGVGA